MSGVISLPSGVFNPYSGVKTSILIIDKHKQKDEIYFSQVNSDGFDLGAQRQPLDINDLPFFLNEIKTESFEKSLIVQKEKIIEKNYSLTMSSYADQTMTSSSYDVVNINELCEFKRGEIITKKTANLEGTIPVVSSGIEPSYYHDKFNREGYTITISGSGNAGYVNFYNEKIWLSDAFSVTSTDENILLDKYLYQVLKNRQEEIFSYQKGAAQKHVYPKDFENFQIPVPPLEKQQEIVDEIEQFQKVIDGARQVIEGSRINHPIFKTDKLIELGKLFEKGKESKIPELDETTFLVGLENIEPNKGTLIGDTSYKEKVKSTKFKFSKGVILYGKLRPNLNKVLLPEIDGYCSTDILVLKPISQIDLIFYKHYFLSRVFNEQVLNTLTGSQLPRTSFSSISQILIPDPNQIDLTEYSREFLAVEEILIKNSEIINIYEKYIEDIITNLYS